VRHHTEYQIYGTDLPFLGRRAQLEHLAMELQKAAQTRSARCVHISGPGGLGKSRVTSEFVSALLNQGHEIRSYWTSFSHRKLDPGFAPLTQIIRQHFGIRAEDKDILARDKLVSGLVELVEGSRLNDAAHLLGALLQLPFAFEFGEVDKGDLSKFMERAYQTCLNLVLLDNSPVVLVIDNIDAASNTISEWFPALTASLAQAPILIVLIGQDPGQIPELPEAFTRGEPITLDPMSDEEILGVIGGFLGCAPGTLDPSLADMVSSRAIGNPRNVEQLIRFFIQSRVITPSQDGWTVSPRRLQEVEVPPDMRGVARERIQTLPPAEREVLEAAAVLGSPFWLTGILSMMEATTPIDPHDTSPWFVNTLSQLREKLQVLSDLEMVSESDGSALRGEEEFIFVSPYERREVLEMLPPDRRNLLHRLAAQWMARTEPNEPSIWNLAISRQFHDSGSCIGEARHLVLAANHARRAFNNTLAVRLYETAIQLMDVDQGALKLEACAKLAWTHRMMGKTDSASFLYRECLRLARVLDDKNEVARVINQMGSLEMDEGHYERAHEALTESLSLYQDLRNLAGVASVRDDLGQLLWHVGAKNAYEEATSQFEQSLALRQELGDERAVARCLTQLGHMNLLRGNLRMAEERYRSALELRRKTGDVRGQAVSMNGLACLFHERGDHKRAIHIWQEVERLSRSVGDQALRAMAHINLAEVNLKLGLHENALNDLKRAEQITQESMNVRVFGHAQRVGAELAIAMGDLDMAEARCKRAMEAAKSSGNRSLTAIALTSRASLRTVQFESGEDHRGTQAEEDLESAISLFEEMGDTVELERSLLVLLQLLRLQQRSEDVQQVEARLTHLQSRTDL